MQVFIISEAPIETARILDRKRLNKQVLECQWIIDGYMYNTRAVNHPIAKMYISDLNWLCMYKRCLECYRDGDINNAEMFSRKAMTMTPDFLTQEYFDNFKKRLYTKDPEHYKMFESYGKTDVNMYFVDGEWIRYINGKRV